jgi:N-dimethylarginine dimethylaminohydrolase
MENSVFLVGWPKDGFSIGTPINQMMVAGAEVCHANPQKFNETANTYFALMVDLMREQGFKVLDTEPVHGGPDGIFLRDKFVYVDAENIMLSHFAN